MPTSIFSVTLGGLIPVIVPLHSTHFPFFLRKFFRTKMSRHQEAKEHSGGQYYDQAQRKVARMIDEHRNKNSHVTKKQVSSEGFKTSGLERRKMEVRNTNKRRRYENFLRHRKTTTTIINDVFETNAKCSSRESVKCIFNKSK